MVVDKVVTDIETVQPPGLEGARVRRIKLASPLEMNVATILTEPVYDTMAIWRKWFVKMLNVETKLGSGALSS